MPIILFFEEMDVRSLIALFVALYPFLTRSGMAAGPDPAQANVPRKEISESDARLIALKLVPGKILEVEKEKHKGELVFSIEIRGADAVHEILININNGNVIEDKRKGSHDDDADETEEHDRG